MKKLYFILFSLFNVSFLLQAQNSIKVLPPAKNEIYFAAFPDFGGEEDNISKEKIEAFDALTERKIAWASFSQRWFKGMNYPKKSIHTIHDMGIIPYVRLLPQSTTKEFQKESHFSLENIIKGKFDNELTQWAKEAKKDQIPLIIDFAVEMNGDWFAWSGKLNGANTKDGYGDKNLYDGPERYRDAYRHLIDIFRAEGVHNVTWFFHANMVSSPKEEWNRPKNYYPGDDYIDWIGVSIYGPFHPGENYWESFHKIVKENYQNILEISDNKPFALLEFGVTDHHPLGSKSEWLQDAFQTILSQEYIHFQAINYWHENWDNDGILTSLRIDSSQKALTTFRTLSANPRFTSKIKLSQ